jgi:hypothetical protein
VVGQFGRMQRSAVAGQVVRRGDRQHAAGADLARHVGGLQASGDADGEIDPFLDQFDAPIRVIHVQPDFRVAPGEFDQ